MRRNKNYIGMYRRYTVVSDQHQDQQCSLSEKMIKYRLVISGLDCQKVIQLAKKVTCYRDSITHQCNIPRITFQNAINLPVMQLRMMDFRVSWVGVRNAEKVICLSQLVPKLKINYFKIILLWVLPSGPKKIFLHKMKEKVATAEPQGPVARPWELKVS